MILRRHTRGDRGSRRPDSPRRGRRLPDRDRIRPRRRRHRRHRRGAGVRHQGAPVVRSADRPHRRRRHARVGRHCHPAGRGGADRAVLARAADDRPAQDDAHLRHRHRRSAVGGRADTRPSRRALPHQCRGDPRSRRRAPTRSATSARPRPPMSTRSSARRCRLILDGGPCRVGVESTIVSFVDADPALLRAGGIALEDIERVIGPVRLATDRSLPLAPGQLPRHYAPRTPIVIVGATAEIAARRPRRRRAAAAAPWPRRDGLCARRGAVRRRRPHHGRGQPVRRPASARRRRLRADLRRRGPRDRPRPRHHGSPAPRQRTVNDDSRTKATRTPGDAAQVLGDLGAS